MRQAEILRDLIEPRILSGVGGEVQYIPVEHPLSIVISQDCDLEQDYYLRFPREHDPRPPEDVDVEPNALRVILLCDAYEVADMESVFPAKFGSKERDFVKKNQNERYHCLRAGSVPSGENLVPSLLDLRTPFAIAPAVAYEQLLGDDPSASRIGLIPDVHSHDLIHRFFSYQARVALPPDMPALALPAGPAAETTGLEPSGPARD